MTVTEIEGRAVGPKAAPRAATWAALFRLDALERVFPALVIGYFALQALVRSMMPGGLGIDEAEQRVMLQSLEWGYGGQPPLYTWAQAGVSAVLGEGKLGFAVLKNACLAGAVLGASAIARRVSGSARAGMVAGLAMVLLPQFSWEAQRSLTHTPLAVAAGMAATLSALHLAERPGLGRAAVLGLALAACCLSKFNAAVFLVAVPLAMGVAARPALGWCLASLGFALVLVAPTAVWTASNLAALTQDSGAFRAATDGGFAARLAGIWKFALAAVLFLALMAAALAAAFAWRGAVARDEGRPLERRLLAWVLGLALGVSLLAVLVSGATEVKERWLQPVLCLAAPLAAALLAKRLSDGSMRWFLRGTGLLVLVLLVAVPMNLRLGGGRPAYQMLPFAPVAAQLATTGPTDLFVLGHLEAGNLLQAAPGLRALIPRYPGMGVPVEAPVQMVWRVPVDAPPGELLALFEARFGRAPKIGPVEVLTAPFVWPHEGVLEIRRAVAR